MSSWSFQRPCVAALLSVATWSAVLAQTPPSPIGGNAALIALTPEDIDARRLMPPPPPEDSARQLRDLAEVRAVILGATRDRRAEAKWDDDHEDPSIFYVTIGNGFDLRSLPATAALMAVVMNDEAIAASAAKRTFPRRRPWSADHTIPTCDPDDRPLTSYPSGHATMGYTVGVILANLIPEKASALQTRASDYAESRVICGSHYRSDGEASRALGTALAIEMLTTPRLQDKIQAARSELRVKGFTSR